MSEAYQMGVRAGVSPILRDRDSYPWIKCNATAEMIADWQRGYDAGRAFLDRWGPIVAGSVERDATGPTRLYPVSWRRYDDEWQRLVEGA